MRLIDADALDMYERLKSYYGDAWRDAQEEIDAQPTVDAVPVIRCKDCKHWQYESCFVESEECDADSIILDRFAFDFCSRAEREEEQ